MIKRPGKKHRSEIPQQITSFEWSDNYATGIRVIDSQHAFLFALTDRLIREVNEGKDISLGKTLDQLLDYAEQHFTFEEKILKQVHYGELPEQHQQHVKMQEHLDSCANNLKQGTLTAKSLVKFLKNWLRHHILDEDMKYVASLKNII